MLHCLLAFLTIFSLGLRSSCSVIAESVKLDLSPFFNAKAASSGLNDTAANFDGSGRAYPVQWLPTAKTFSFTGIEVYLFPLSRVLASEQACSSTCLRSIICLP